MKRKLLLFVCCLFATFGISTAFAQTTFTAVAPSGHLLQCVVTTSTTVRVEAYSNDNSGDLIIPSTVSYGGTTYTVTEIPAAGFSNNYYSLTSVTVPNTVTTIGNYAFNLVGNVIYNGTASGSPWGALTVNGYVRDGLVYSDNTMTTLTAWSTGLTSATIPNSVTSIGEYAFYCCSSLTSLTIPNSVTSIGFAAFAGCSSLTSLTIPNSVTSIGNTAFSRCSSLTSLTIPNSVTSIGEYAFYGCDGLTSVTIPNSVTSIGQEAFYGCDGLTSVTIPNSVTSIGSKAFYNCSSLTSVTIPNSVTSIGRECFAGCTELRNIVFESTIPPTIGNNCFQNVPLNAIVTAPCNCRAAYMSATSYYFNYITENCSNNGGGDNGGGNTSSDTTIVQHGDTVFVTIRDTVYIHDTVCPSTNSIAPTTISDIDIELVGRQIVVSGADGMPVSIYDVQGRPLATMHAAFGQTVRFDVPATGVYMVRVGNIKTQRVAVLR